MLSRPIPARVKRETIWMSVVLAILVFIPFAQVATFEFLLCDDNDYITNSPTVRQGITWEGVKWAFRTAHASNWHPLTWLSHMLDCEMFGLNAGAHHIVGALIHTLNAVLLFLALRLMTGSLWRSAAATVLFAIHPLRAESVAWVAERKDVLSGTFWMLTLLTYGWYARKPGIWRYLLVFLSLGIGLMAKSMAVTMPFLLLLLDVWPLNRGRIPGVVAAGLRKAVPCPRKSWGILIAEKVPLFVLAVIISKVSIWAQGGYGSITSTDELTIGMRLANGLVSYGAYLVNMFFPVNLGLFYPHPVTVSRTLSEDLYVPATISGIVLLGITALLLYHGRQRPWLPIGWFWYLGTLVPVIGIVQIGAQSHADRYTYLTMIGLAVALVWSIGEIIARRPELRPVVRWVGAAVTVLLLALTWIQVSHWKTDFTLFERSAKVIPKNYFAYNQLGAAYRERAVARKQKGDFSAEREDRAKAEECFRKSLEFNADYDFGNNNLGVSLLERGVLEEARQAFERAVTANPVFIPPLRNLALIYAHIGNPAMAAKLCEHALSLQPENGPVHAQLAGAYEQLSRFQDAERHYKLSLQLEPYNPLTLRQMGMFYINRERLLEAATALEQCVAIQQGDPDAWNALGVVYSKQGAKARALEALQNALKLDPRHPGALNNLQVLQR